MKASKRMGWAGAGLALTVTVVAGAGAALAQQTRPPAVMAPPAFATRPALPGAAPTLSAPPAPMAMPDVVLNRPGGCPEGLGKCPPAGLPAAPQPNPATGNDCTETTTGCKK